MNQAPVKNLHEPVINLALLNYLYHRSGKTIEQLASETGYSIATWSRALNGLCTNIFTYGHIAKALQSSLRFITDTELTESEFHCAVASSDGAVSDRSRGGSGRSKISKKKAA